MHIKEIVVDGFKSYAHRTVIRVSTRILTLLRD